MRFATIAAVFSVVAGASAAAVKNGTEYTTTEVVTKYTTYCPLPTTIVEGNKTYTVTKATTLTITDCPCTRTKVYTTILPTAACTGKCSVSVPIGTGYGPAPTGSSNPVYPNGTIPTSKPSSGSAGPGANVTKPAPTSAPSTPPFTGSANKATVAGAALAGLIGAVAYLL